MQHKIERTREQHLDLFRDLHDDNPDYTVGRYSFEHDVSQKDHDWIARRYADIRANHAASLH